MRKNRYCIKRIKGYPELDAEKLMEVYSESNLKNTDYFYPEM